jgi:hypothetical protein
MSDFTNPGLGTSSLHNTSHNGTGAYSDYFKWQRLISFKVSLGAAQHGDHPGEGLIGLGQEAEGLYFKDIGTAVLC